MIKAIFYRSGPRLTGFSVSGHSGYADAGADIVCASVSSAVMLICNAVTEVYKISASVSVGENTVALKTDSPDTRFIEALKLHLEALSEEYPKNIEVTVSEVL